MILALILIPTSPFTPCLTPSLASAQHPCLKDVLKSLLKKGVLGASDRREEQQTTTTIT